MQVENGNGTDLGGRSKRRGVRASRVRLEHALARSDLPKKTQAALADKIADIEQLDAAPKDLVSKAFRQHPVDAQTLERIARALNVPADTLYMDDPPGTGEATPDDGNATRKRRRTSLLIAGWVAVLAAVSAAVFIPKTGDMACSLREWISPPDTPSGRIGIVVARFDQDPGNMAQDFLASSLLSDRNLAPYISVLLTCRRPAVGDSGDLRNQIDSIRETAQGLLSRSGAQLMLWGKVRDGRLQVRFVSTRRDVSAVTLEMSGRPLRIEEANIELQIDPGNPGGALADMKRLALDLLKIEDPALARVRNEAINAYDFSIDWLRASIVSQHNLRRQIDPAIDPRRWANVNSKLCYEHRLLGDHDADADQYRQALEACDETLSVRPRDRFPRDWAATQINKSSALIRLHYYADELEHAIALLREAETALLAAAEVLDRRTTPQLWAVMQRNLGTAYLRLGEVTSSADSGDYFNEGIARLKSSLTVQDPDFQPLDWAITQQNLCLALYQHGARLGADGVAYVREAHDRCQQAKAKLARDDAALSWAMVQNNLAVATAILSQLQSDADQLEEAIDAFKQAQSVYTRDRLPGNWAEVEVNLGELHCNLAIMKSDPAILDSAAAHTEAALQIFIENGNRRYQRYAEGLLTAIRGCADTDISQCRCGP